MRGCEGPMDWEYQHEPPVDHSSPFAKLRQREQTATFQSPTKFAAAKLNPFISPATTFLRSSPAKPESQPWAAPRAPEFNPRLRGQPSAPTFRNPAFASLHTRADEITTPTAGDETPAVTEASTLPANNPELEDSAHMTTNSAKVVYRSSLSGLSSKLPSRARERDEMPRATRDKVRKRKRQHGDRDVGSVRPRLPHDSDRSDSDWEVSWDGGQKFASGRRKRAGMSSFLSLVSQHPDAPAILGSYLRFFFQLVLLSGVLYAIFELWSMVRSDVASANSKARDRMLEETRRCAEQFARNRCEPELRVPHMDEQCEAWAACMTQDPDAVMRVQVSVRNTAEIVNEFVGALSLKAWVFVVSLLLIVVVASRSSNYLHLQSAPSMRVKHIKAPEPPPSQPAAPLFFRDPNQAYIWAPLAQTPRKNRHDRTTDGATDTDQSPGEIKTIMPSRSMSRRRRPSKGERGRSSSTGFEGC